MNPASPTLVVGIDPGTKGGISWVQPDYPETMSVVPMPEDERERVAVIRSILNYAANPATDVRVVVEQAKARPTDGAVQTETFLRAYGILIGAVYSAGIPMEHLHEITAQQWQKCFPALEVEGGKGMTKELRRKLRKDNSRMEAARLFPVHAGRLKTKSSDGLSDAMLICWYGCGKVQPPTKEKPDGAKKKKSQGSKRGTGRTAAAPGDAAGCA